MLQYCPDIERFRVTGALLGKHLKFRPSQQDGQHLRPKVALPALQATACWTTAQCAHSDLCTLTPAETESGYHCSAPLATQLPLLATPLAPAAPLHLLPTAFADSDVTIAALLPLPTQTHLLATAGNPSAHKSDIKQNLSQQLER
jgi:hypothetical protein